MSCYPQKLRRESGSLVPLAAALAIGLVLLLFWIQGAANNTDDAQTRVNAGLTSAASHLSRLPLVSFDEALSQPALSTNWETQVQDAATLLTQATGSGQLTGTSAVEVIIGAYEVDPSGTVAPYPIGNHCHTAGAVSAACNTYNLDQEALEAAQRSGALQVREPFLAIAVVSEGKVAKDGVRMRPGLAEGTAPPPPPPGPSAGGPVVITPGPTVPVEPDAGEPDTGEPFAAGEPDIISTEPETSEPEGYEPSVSEPTTSEPTTSEPTTGEPDILTSGEPDALSTGEPVTTSEAEVITSTEPDSITSGEPDSGFSADGSALE